MTFNWVGNDIFWNCTLKHTTLWRNSISSSLITGNIIVVKPNETNCTFCFHQPKKYKKHQTIKLIKQICSNNYVNNNSCMFALTSYTILCLSWPLAFFTAKVFNIFHKQHCHVFTVDIIKLSTRGEGGVLLYMGDIGMCRGIGFGFRGSQPINRISLFSHVGYCSQCDP